MYELPAFEQFRSGMTWYWTVSFSQGAEEYNYRPSLSNIQNNGIFPNAHLGRKQISFHGSVDLSDRLRMSGGQLSAYAKAGQLQSIDVKALGSAFAELQRLKHTRLAHSPTA